jgi:hypothetical protein
MPDYRQPFSRPGEQSNLAHLSWNGADAHIPLFFVFGGGHDRQNISISGLGFQATVPDTAQLNTTNSVASITSQAQACASQYGTYPNFVLVDFYDAGNGSALQAAAQLNGVTYIPVAMGKLTGHVCRPLRFGMKIRAVVR